MPKEVSKAYSVVGISFPLWEIERILPEVTYINNYAVLAPVLWIGLYKTLVIKNVKPQLAYVLPFKAQRITVFHTEGGLPLYSY